MIQLEESGDNSGVSSIASVQNVEKKLSEGGTGVTFSKLKLPRELLHI